MHDNERTLSSKHTNKSILDKFPLPSIYVLDKIEQGCFNAWKPIKLFEETQSPLFTFSKLTIETLDQGVKVKILVSLLLTPNMFHTLL